MKLTTKKTYKLVDRTIDGVTHQVRQPVTETVPVIPRDWDVLATRAALALVTALTLIGVVWSTVSIGALLGGGVGYAAALVFDVSWLTVLILEYLARFDAAKRRTPRRLGWALVLTAATASGWHGLVLGSLALAVVGASVSVVSKLLWLALFHHIERELSPPDEDWVKAEISRMNATLALASVRRQVARAEAVAAAELLAAERIRAAVRSTDAPVIERVDLGEDDANTANNNDGDRRTVFAGPPPPPAGTSANTERTSANASRTLAGQARAHLAAGAGQAETIAAILTAVPDAKKESVQATVRRQARLLAAADRPPSGGYL